MPMWRRMFLMLFLVISSSLKKISPEVGSSRRLMQRKKVDLPEPDGPRTATHSPVESSKFMPLRIFWSPKFLWRFLTVITFSQTFLNLFDDK